MKKILIVAHAPSNNTQLMLNSLLAGIERNDLPNITYKYLNPLQAQPSDVLTCDAIILGTTENLGYMSGALKDFFDRIYYPCLDAKQGLPFCYYIRAGHDGTGTKIAIDNICNGLKWKKIQAEIICRGQWRDDFLDECRNIGENIACGLDFGIY